VKKLRALADIAVEICDDPDNDLETGAPKAREIYEDLDNDSRMYLNGLLRERKFTNQETGREKAYWAVFVEFLKAAA